MRGPISNNPELNQTEMQKVAAQRDLDRLNRLFKKGPTRELLAAIRDTGTRVLRLHDDVERLYAVEVEKFIAGYNVTARALRAYGNAGLTEEDLNNQAELMKPESMEEPGGQTDAYDQGAYYAACFWLDNAEFPATIDRSDVSY